MRLIKELCSDVKFITEDVNGEKNLYIQGVFMQSDLKNRNGRVYPQEVLNKEVDRYIKEYVDSNRALGELGHPDTPTVNLDRVSHIITELDVNGTNVIGKARIIDTPCGVIARSLLAAGVQLGVSSRGLGSLVERNDGVQTVQDDFILAAVDIVADPSAPDAFVQGVLENKEWIHVGNNKFRERAIDKAKKAAKNVRRQNLEEDMLRIFANFLLDVTNQKN